MSNVDHKRAENSVYTNDFEVSNVKAFEWVSIHPTGPINAGVIKNE